MSKTTITGRTSYNDLTAHNPIPRTLCCCESTLEVELHRTCTDAILADERRAPTADEQQAAASLHYMRDIVLGVQYRTGPRRGQQLAAARKAG